MYLVEAGGVRLLENGVKDYVKEIRRKQKGR